MKYTYFNIFLTLALLICITSCKSKKDSETKYVDCEECGGTGKVWEECDKAEADVFPAMELAARNVLLAVAEDSPNVYHATVAELNNAACAWVEVTISTAANVSHVVVEV